MPIYEYTCAACGHEMEALQKISDAPLTQCPACGKPELRKRITAAAFRLKGTGWYETDFKNAGKAAKKKAGDKGGKSDASASDDSKSGTKSDSGGKKKSTPSTAASGGGDS